MLQRHKSPNDLPACHEFIAVDLSTHIGVIAVHAHAVKPSALRHLELRVLGYQRVIGEVGVLPGLDAHLGGECIATPNPLHLAHALHLHIAKALGAPTDVIADEGVFLTVGICVVAHDPQIVRQIHGGLAFCRAPGRLPKRRRVHRGRLLPHAAQLHTFPAVERRKTNGIPYQVQVHNLVHRAGKQVDVEGLQDLAALQHQGLVAVLDGVTPAAILIQAEVQAIHPRFLQNIIVI